MFVTHHAGRRNSRIDIRHARGAFLIALSTVMAAAPIAARAGSISQTDGTAIAMPDDGYRLGPGDRLKITVYGEDRMTGEYLVSEGDAISFPLIGDFAVGGKTISELRSALQTRLSQGILVNPQISAQIVEFRPFYILGEINKPGKYPYSIGLTLYNAVATAQGFTYRASTRKVLITHAGDGIEHVVKVTPSTRILPGDTVRVIEKFF